MDNSINKLNLPVYRPINNTLVSGDKVQLEDIPEIQSSIIKNSKESPENEARSTATESSINITNEIKEKASNNQHTIPQGKYNIAYDSNATVKPPNGFSTDDYDLKMTCDLLNQPKSQWNKVKEADYIQIYKQNVPGIKTTFFKTVSVIVGFTKEEITTALIDVNLRKKWDDAIAKLDVLEKFDDDHDIVYMAQKAPSMLITARDFVLRRRIYRNFPDEKSLMIIYRSVSHEKGPENKKLVRGETVLYGVLLREANIDPLKTEIYLIANMDVKGSVPVSMFNSIMEGKQEEIISKLVKGCKLVIEGLK